MLVIVMRMTYDEYTIDNISDLLLKTVTLLGPIVQFVLHNNLRMLNS